MRRGSCVAMVMVMTLSVKFSAVAQTRSGAAQAKPAPVALESAIEDGDGLAILELAHRKVYKPTVEDIEGEMIDRCVAQRKNGPRVKADEFTVQHLTNGLTIEFGPGVHNFDMMRLYLLQPGGPRVDRFPDDVTLKGAGVDATRVCLVFYVDPPHRLRQGKTRVGGPIRINNNVNRIALRDMTIDCGWEEMFDMRGCFGLVIDLERVRIAQFRSPCYTSIGGIFSVAGGCMLRASESEFICANNGDQHLGTMFGRKDIVLGRFTDCSFKWNHSEEWDSMCKEISEENSMIVFQNCRFEHFIPILNRYPNVIYKRSGSLRTSASVLRESGSGRTANDPALESLAWAIEDWDGPAIIEYARRGIYKPTVEDIEGLLLDHVVAPRKRSPVVKASQLKKDREHLVDGLVITFGPGVHDFDTVYLEELCRERFGEKL